jgi:hypothetical protein
MLKGLALAGLFAAALGEATCARCSILTGCRLQNQN